MKLKIYISSAILTLLRLFIIPQNQNPDQEAHLIRYNNSIISKILGSVENVSENCKYKSDYYSFFNKMEGICSYNLTNLITIFQYYILNLLLFICISELIFKILKYLKLNNNLDIKKVELSVLLSILMPSIIVMNGYIYDDILAVYLSLFTPFIAGIVLIAFFILILYLLDHGTSIVVLSYLIYIKLLNYFINFYKIKIYKIILISISLIILIIYKDLIFFYLFNNKYNEVFAVINSNQINNHGYIERILYFIGTSSLMLNTGQKNLIFSILIFVLVLIFLFYKKIEYRNIIKVLIFILIMIYILPTHAYVKYYVLIYPIILFTLLDKFKDYIILNTIFIVNFLNLFLYLFDQS